MGSSVWLSGSLALTPGIVCSTTLIRNLLRSSRLDHFLRPSLQMSFCLLGHVDHLLNVESLSSSSLSLQMTKSREALNVRTLVRRMLETPRLIVILNLVGAFQLETLVKKWLSH